MKCTISDHSAQLIFSDWQWHTCQLFLFDRNCPYFDPRKKGEKRVILSCVPIFCKNLPVVMYRKFRNVRPPICPYFLVCRVGKYVMDITENGFLIFWLNVRQNGIQICSSNVLCRVCIFHIKLGSIIWKCTSKKYLSKHKLLSCNQNGFYVVRCLCGNAIFIWNDVLIRGFQWVFYYVICIKLCINWKLLDLGVNHDVFLSSCIV